MEVLPAPEHWLLWLDGCRSPFVNMAIDELLLNESVLSGQPLVRIYGWSMPSVSIGYVQKLSAAPDTGYTVVRRPTGGGVVFHDHDLTYTVVVPPTHPIAQLDRMESYHVFHRAVLRALAAFEVRGQLAPEHNAPVDRAVMQCFTTPTRYDVVGGHGEKYAGAAQRRTREGILHQGSIDLAAVDGARDRLCRELVVAFQEEFGVIFDSFGPTEALVHRADVLAEAKYARHEWNEFRQIPAE